MFFFFLSLKYSDSNGVYVYSSQNLVNLDFIFRTALGEEQKLRSSSLSIFRNPVSYRLTLSFSICAFVWLRTQESQN
jgi:hypothetical protein